MFPFALFCLSFRIIFREICTSIHHYYQISLSFRWSGWRFCANDGGCAKSRIGESLYHDFTEELV